MPKLKQPVISDGEIRKLLQDMETMPSWVPQLPMPFDADFADFIKGMSAKTIDSLIKQFCNMSIRYDFIFPDMDRMLGPDWYGHALRHDPVFWYKALSEPDITNLIAYTLRNNQKNIRAFLQTLCKCCPPAIVNNFICNNAYIDDVRAEVPATRQKKSNYSEKCKTGRIDNLFAWGTKEDTRVVIIEAKFDADLDNPLCLYEEKAKEIYKDRKGIIEQIEANILHVLLIQHPISYIKNKIESLGSKEQWHIVYWQDLLPKWENLLKNDDVQLPHTAAVRHSIFQKIYEG